MSEYLDPNRKGIPLEVNNSNPTNDPKLKEEIQYIDTSFVGLWDARDQPIMDRMFHNRIRALNNEFQLLRLKELRLYLNNFTRSGKQRLNLVDIPGMPILWEQKAGIHEARWILIESFEQVLSRSFEDKTIPQGTPEPHEAVKQEDMVTNYGMERFASLICNESNTYFTHVATGSSLIPAGIGQTYLFDEKERAPVSENGWMTAKGRYLRGGAEFPKTTPGYFCRESGIFDHATAGGCAWRTVYPTAKVVEHIMDSTYITISHTVDQGSVGL